MPNYKPYRPRVVDPDGVDPSIQPRPMPVTTDESRAITATETGGQPLTTFEGTSNPYIDYQSIDVLLSLQHMRSDGYVERIIGYKPGTGGSSGVAWLDAVTRHRFFPELWAIRT